MRFGRRRPEPPISDADEFTADALAMLDVLYRAALRLSRNPDTAQDLVQDTYLRAFRARHRFSAGTNLKAWLFTILHNGWRNRQREASRARVEADSSVVDRAAAGEMDTVSARPDTPETRLLDATLSDALKTALDGLPEAFREVVWLRDVEELSYQEIAGVLEIPVGTVMSRLSRARRQLHEALVGSRRATAS
jgi:RNA polymerase sigma-70 factor (ECF subfamily)